MPKQSAGITVFRSTKGKVEVLLVHPGGPFWSKKDTWSIPKGELEEGEDKASAAAREFEEEVGFKPPEGKLIDLGESKQGSKTNFIWAVEGDADLARFKSNTFTMEWPPKSGQEQEFPESDQADWFALPVAKAKVFKSQVVFIERLAEKLGVDIASKAPSDVPDESPEQQSLL